MAIEKLKEDAKRIFLSYSTWVVVAFTAMPDMWAAMPDEYRQQVYELVPQLRGLEVWLWCASFAVSYWKARNAAQGIDQTKQ